jgi:hypothetical protein
MNPDTEFDLVREHFLVDVEPDTAVRGAARSRLLEKIQAERRDRRRVPLRRRVRALGARQVALVASALAIGATGATAGTILALNELNFSHDTPAELFRSNPRWQAPWGREALIPGTVRYVESVQVPTVGSTQFWSADSRPYGICLALRLPGGTWAGGEGARFPFSGPVPGCENRPVGWAGAWNGFVFLEYQVANWRGRVAIGIVPTRGRPTEVRDAIGGTTTPVIDGRYFAIVIPASQSKFQDGMWHLIYRLETLDQAGHVLVRAPAAVFP